MNLQQFLRKVGVFVFQKPQDTLNLAGAQTIDDPITDTTQNVLSIENLRVTFNIVKNLKQQSDKSTITIYNLSSTSRNIIDNFDQKIILKVGYAEDVPTYQNVIGTDLENTVLQNLYVGDVQTVIHDYESPNWITKLYLGDGEDTIRESKISVSYPPGEKAITVLKDIVGKMGVALKQNIDNLISQDKLMKKGFNFNGLAKDAINKIAEKYSLDWTMQDETLLILQKLAADEEVAFIVSKETGMIGIPKRLRGRDGKSKKLELKPGYNVKTLLNPNIKPGKLVNIISEVEDIDSEYIVESVRHSGDNFGDTWESDMKVSFK